MTARKSYLDEIALLATLAQENSVKYYLVALGAEEPHPNQKVLQIVRALDFAAWAHSAQRRKVGAREPYVNHLTEVARLVAQATGGNDDKLIIAALLHDVLEDQSIHVSYDMLVDYFGKRVANIVREVTDDKSLPKDERKRLQVVHAPHLSRRAKILKIADKSANLNSILQTPPHDWSATRKRKDTEAVGRVHRGDMGCQ